MSNISKIPVTKWEDELIALTNANSVAPVQLSGFQIMAHKPNVAKAFARFANAMWADMTLPPRMIELVRLRIAFFTQCRMCLSIRYRPAVEDGLTEGVVCSLEHPSESDDLTPAEKCALDYAERLATDHLSITHQTYDGLRKHFSEPQIVELGLFIAYAVGTGRFQATLDNVEETNAAYRSPQKGAVTPWSGEPLVVG